MSILSSFILPGIIFLFTLAFGIWLSRKSRPYNVILFNIHKLIALGAVIFTAIRLYEVFKVTQIESIFIALVVLLGLGVVALFVTGALLSASKMDRAPLLTVHRIAPALAVVSAGMIFYFLIMGIK